MYQCRLHEPGKPSLKNCGNGEFQYCYVTRPTEKKVSIQYTVYLTQPVQQCPVEPGWWTAVND